MKRLSLFLLTSIILFGSCTPSLKFETNEDFSKWLSGKEFTSTDGSKKHYYSDGSLGLPTSVTIQFDGDKVQYQNCSPTSYNIYKDGNLYVVSFTPDCIKGDDMELIVDYENELFYTKSLIYSEDRASHNSGSGFAKLDEIVKQKKGQGPFMSIVK